MATIYNFKVQCVSDFCAYDDTIATLIREALEDYENTESGLGLESITVESDRSK